MSVDIEKIAKLLTQADARIGHLEAENEMLKQQVKSQVSLTEENANMEKTSSSHFEQEFDSDFSLGEAVNIPSQSKKSAESALDSFLA